MSHSSTDSEILALDDMLRYEGIPVLGLRQCLAENHRATSGAEGPAGARRIPMMMGFEDKDVVIKVTLNKSSMALHHVTLRAALNWLSTTSMSTM